MLPWAARNLSYLNRGATRWKQLNKEIGNGE
ncbi:hypothetical protein SRS16P3_00002 (plasmid) [Variovorax sp. SRS16]|nr:hypothetical protein SRS16P3_00002 [Variovorax sp. SRS16]